MIALSSCDVVCLFCLCQIKQDIGQCQNIHVVYDSATTFMCRNALDGLVRITLS